MSQFTPRQFRGVFLGVVTGAVTATVPSTVTTVNGFIGSISLPGVLAGDIVLVAPVVAQTAGVSFTAEVTAADTIAITAHNGSAGTYNPGSQVFNVVALRAKLS